MQLQKPCTSLTGSGSQLYGSRERAELKYSDADCGAFINKLSYTHTHAPARARTHAYTSPCLHRLHGGKWTPGIMRPVQRKLTGLRRKSHAHARTLTHTSKKSLQNRPDYRTRISRDTCGVEPRHAGEEGGGVGFKRSIIRIPFT